MKDVILDQMLYLKPVGNIVNPSFFCNGIIEGDNRCDNGTIFIDCPVVCVRF